MASIQKPEYTVYIVSGATKYDVTQAVIDMDFSDQAKQMAQYVILNLMNVKVGNDWLTSLISVRDRVYIHANDGSKNEEIFRGYVWTRSYKETLTDGALQLKCYDNLIYFQESDESSFFSSGKSTKDVATTICKKWGVPLEYDYESITHGKLALRGKLADIFTADVLDLVKDRTGTKYCIISDKDTMHIKSVGSNTTIYHFENQKNVTSITSECTMDGMVTQVVILGKEDGDDRKPVEATVAGETSKYGTLQKIIDRDENTSLADAKKEAQSIIDADGEPKWVYELATLNVPWVRKGDKVYSDVGDVKGYFIITGIDRAISKDKQEMILTMEKP